MKAAPIILGRLVVVLIHWQQTIFYWYHLDKTLLLLKMLAPKLAVFAKLIEFQTRIERLLFQ
jgi:hypothetical protein